MASPQTALEFLALCYQHGLVEPERLLRRFSTLDTLPQDPQELSSVLRETGFLTAYQIERIFAGEADRLVLGPYRILGPLGEGGSGLVFLAEQTALKRLVALKLVRPERETPLNRERLLREAQAGATLDHPNIVRVIDLCQAGEITFLVMEYVTGIDLQQKRQQEGALPLPEAVRLVLQVAAALDHLHRRGLVHRDVKPSNLMLTPDGTAKLLDMGLACPADDASLGSVAGTMGFMAPEQAMGQKIDARSDIYSLGMVLHALLTNRNLFKSPTEERLAHLGLIPPPSMSQLLAGVVPPRFLPVISRMTNYDPASRYQSIEEVVQALSPWLTRPLTLRINEQNRLLGPAPRRFGWKSSVIVMGLVVLLLGVSWIIWSRNAPPPAPDFQLSETFEPISAVLSEVVYSPDGKDIYGCDWSGNIHKWNCKTRKRKTVYADVDKRARYLCMCKDRKGEHLISAGMFCPVRCLELASGTVTKELPPQGHRTWGLALSPDEKFLAIGGEAGVVIRDWNTGKLVRTLRTQFEYIWTLAYTPDGQYLAVGGRNSRTLHTLVLYDAQTGEPCRWFKDHLKPVRSICFHPTEPLIVSGGFDGWIHVRNYLTGDEVAKYLAIREGYIERVVFLADGKHVLLSGGSPDGKTLELAGMVVWNFTNGKEAARWETEELVGLVCMQVSPDGQWIVTGGKREGVRLWKMPPLLAK